MKTRITTYTFDASAKTVTFSGPLDIEGLQLITNVVDNIIIYNFADATKGGTFSTNTLTLTYDTSSMSDTDELMILYEDGVNTQTVSGSVTANAGTNLNTSALALETGGNLAAIKTNTDDIETLLTTIEGNQLPDGHNVTIDNVSIDVDTGLTQPLTNTELRATPVPVSGTVTANTGLSQPLTDTQLRATAVPVDLGVNNDVTVTSGAITETNSGAIKTAVELIDNAISGNEMQVDVLTMPTTTVQATDLDIRNLTSVSDSVVAVSSGDVAAGATDSGNPIKVGGKYNSTKPTLTDGQRGDLQVTTRGMLGVSLYDADTSTKITAEADNADDVAASATANNLSVVNRNTVYDGSAWDRMTQPLTDTQIRATALPVSVASVPSHNVTNAGTFATQATLAAETTKVIGTVRVASGGIASGSLASGSIATGAIVDAKADDSAFTPATSRVFPMGAIADEASTDSVDEGDVGVPRMTLDRKQIVSVYPSATGEGLDIFRSIDLDETEEDVKTSAGKLFGWFIHNKNAATLYLKFYNATAANTTVGTTTPILTIPVPSGASANVEYTNGIAFSTALCAAVTTGVADNDTGAPAANDFIANIFYK